MKIGAAVLDNEKESFLNHIKLANEADFIQIDVMDGVFIPGKKTVWINEIKEGLKKVKVPVELHLMISNPDLLIDDFLKLNAETYIFHYESTKNHKEIIDKIRLAKKKVGIALKLSTSATVLRNLLNDLDLVLVYCTENIGEQGPKFSITATKNIHIIREYDEKILIEVDGGIKPHTARLSRLAGATQAVSGSFLFTNNFSQDSLDQLKKA